MGVLHLVYGDYVIANFTGGETNYVIATLSLYLNIYNLFVSLLNLLMALLQQSNIK